MGPRRRCVNSGIARRDGADERWNWVIPVAGRPKVRSPVAGRGGEDGMSPVARRPIMVPLFSCKAGLQAIPKARASQSRRATLRNRQDA